LHDADGEAGRRLKEAVAVFSSLVGSYREDKARCFLEVYKKKYKRQWTQAAIR